MLLRSKHWLSSAVLRDEKVREAINDIRRLAKKYRDAGSPALLENAGHLVLAPEVSLFRPNAGCFVLLVLVFAVSVLGYSWAGGGIDTVAWADLALKAVVPIFVLGISVVSLTRGLSEAGRFTGEYLNEACRMPLFCCLSFLAGIMAFTGWLMAKISWFHLVVSSRGFGLRCGRFSRRGYRLLCYACVCHS